MSYHLQRVFYIPVCKLLISVYISGYTRGLGAKFTPALGLDNRIWLMTSSVLWRHQLYILHTRILKNRFWSAIYTPDDCTPSLPPTKKPDTHKMLYNSTKISLNSCLYVKENNKKMKKYYGRKVYAWFKLKGGDI